MASYLTQLLERIAAIQTEAVSPIMPVVAVPYSLYVQSDYPYFTNRLSEEQDAHIAADAEEERYTIVMRLVIGHLKDTHHGVDERILYEIIPAVNAAFRGKHWLQTDADSGAIPEMNADPVSLTGNSGIRFFTSPLVRDAYIVGVEWRLTVAFYIDNKRRY